MTCDMCNGTGTVGGYDGPYGDPEHAWSEDCPDCAGVVKRQTQRAQNAPTLGLAGSTPAPGTLPMRQVLARLELVAHGSTTSLDANRVHGGGEHPSRMLRSDPDGYPHLVFRRRWDGCRTEAQRRVVFAEACVELRRLTVAPDPPVNLEPERESFAWKRMVAEDSDSVDEVARRFSVSRRTVYRYREKYRR